MYSLEWVGPISWNGWGKKKKKKSLEPNALVVMAYYEHINVCLTWDLYVQVCRALCIYRLLTLYIQGIFVSALERRGLFVLYLLHCDQQSCGAPECAVAFT